MTIEEIYTCINCTIIKCKDYGFDDLAERFDDALHLGSSGLEILGAIRNVLEDEKSKANKLIGKGRVQEIIDFVEFSYGMK